MNVYEIITDEIIKSLESGIIAWKKPWTVQEPVNFTSKKAYRGINRLLLSNSQFKSRYWLTLKQVNDLDGSVKAGSKSKIVVFWKWIEQEEEEGKIKDEFPVLRYYRVFNIEQTTLSIPVENKAQIEPIEACQNIVEGYKNKPVITESGDQAYYIPSKDIVNLPPVNTFLSSEGYFSTLFHELVHSTGHESRLNRETLVHQNRFGSEDYSREELIAELGACFLCSESGIKPKVIDNAAAYIQGWLKALKNDKKMIILASAKAQKAVDYILGREEKKD